MFGLNFNFWAILIATGKTCSGGRRLFGSHHDVLKSRRPWQLGLVWFSERNTLSMQWTKNCFMTQYFMLLLMHMEHYMTWFYRLCEIMTWGITTIVRAPHRPPYWPYYGSRIRSPSPSCWGSEQISAVYGYGVIIAVSYRISRPYTAVNTVIFIAKLCCGILTTVCYHLW